MSQVTSPLSSDIKLLEVQVEGLNMVWFKWITGVTWWEGEDTNNFDMNRLLQVLGENWEALKYRAKGTSSKVIRGMGTLSSLLKVLNERKASTVNGRVILQDEWHLHDTEPSTSSLQIPDM
jgi:hypothetical protein